MGQVKVQGFKSVKVAKGIEEYRGRRIYRIGPRYWIVAGGIVCDSKAEAMAAIDAAAPAREAEAGEVVHEGFTRGQLQAAWEPIQNATNWKAGISGLIPVSQLAAARAAAEFYAGSPLTVVYEEPVGLGPERKCVVTGPGYYACIGS